MANPWLKKNPFMSMWLSAAHSVAGTAGGRIASRAKRQTHAAVANTAQAAVGYWTNALLTKPKPRKSRKPKR